MSVGYVVLFVWIGLEVEERHGGGQVAGSRAGVVDRLVLFIGSEQRHAVGSARIDPFLLGVGRFAALVRGQHVQFPAGVADGCDVGALRAEDDVVWTFGLGG